MKLKEKLRKRRQTIGSWITIASSDVAEIMAKTGFEWLVVDMEHSSIGFSECQNLVRTIELCGIAPLVRVGKNDPLIIKRVMDAGAHGIVVPMVNSKRDAESAIDAVHYPPMGGRGVGLHRAQGYGVTFQEYKKWLKKESVIIAQIEHKEGVESIDEILSLDGIDGIFVGPYDLSASYGEPGNFSSKNVKEALKRIVKSAHERKKSCGFHVVYPDIALMKNKIKEGYNVLAYSTDFLLLGEACRSGLNALKRNITK